MGTISDWLDFQWKLFCCQSIWEIPLAPHGFPAWLRLTHFVNFFFLMLLVRSGLSILMDHPRLYWNRRLHPEFGVDAVHATQSSDPRRMDCEGGRPLHFSLAGFARVSAHRGHGALVAFPFGLRIPSQRFHFYRVAFLHRPMEAFGSDLMGNRSRLVESFVYYATFHLPAEPNGFYQYNPLQQLSYFAVIFIMAPLSMLTGIAMSPAVDNRFPFFPKLFGSRQGARSIHFLLLIGYLCFLAVHVGLVAVTGFVRNMNHIVTGRDDAHLIGMVLGLVAIGLVVLSWASFTLSHGNILGPCSILNKAITGLFHWNVLSRLKPDERYTKEDISPFFWPNGKMPTSNKWRQLAANGFKDFQLKIDGLVENPLELSLGGASRTRQRRIHFHASLYPRLVGNRAMGRASI